MRVIEAEGSRQAVCIWSLHLAAAAEHPEGPAGGRSFVRAVPSLWMEK